MTPLKPYTRKLLMIVVGAVVASYPLSIRFTDSLTSNLLLSIHYVLIIRGMDSPEHSFKLSKNLLAAMFGRPKAITGPKKRRCLRFAMPETPYGWFSSVTAIISLDSFD